MAKKQKRLAEKTRKQLKAQTEITRLFGSAALARAFKFVQAVPTAPDSELADLQLELAILQAWAVPGKKGKR